VSERDPEKSEGPIRSAEQFMRRYLPKEYAKRKAEGRCIHCGERPSGKTGRYAR
jgi:hypothetical protein